MDQDEYCEQYMQCANEIRRYRDQCIIGNNQTLPLRIEFPIHRGHNRRITDQMEIECLNVFDRADFDAIEKYRADKEMVLRACISLESQNVPISDDEVIVDSYYKSCNEYNYTLRLKSILNEFMKVNIENL